MQNADLPQPDRPETSFNHHTATTVLDGFARQVACAPERVALMHHDRRINYRELDAWSSQLARWIAERAGAHLSATREPLIPLALAQGPARIAVILAVLKLGGAYVPIEPSYPAARIRQILDDIGAELVITESALADGVVAAADRGVRPLEVLQVDVADHDIARQDPGPMTPQIDAESACYVMYTSGSTGKPKGIVIPHRGVVRLCIGANYMVARPEHCFAQLANIAFDASTWEIWGALLNGARIALLDPEALLATAVLGDAIREHHITHMFLTTSLWHQHVAADPAIFAPLEYLLFGGEAASAATMRRIFAAPARPRHLVNVYGPTENTTYSTTYEPTSPPAGDAVPIGVPVAGSTCNVVREVDGQFVVVQPGERGEMLVGGLGLAREYLHDPVATRAKFIECAFAPGERLYRTGDLVEELPSGDFVFVGRIDNQVKLRGFRIELEEIEQALAAHPAIGGAVVTIEAGSADHKRLVATLVLSAVEPTPTVRELRDFLAERLPTFMIPAVFVRVAAFPLSATGKADRRKLAELPREPLSTSRRQRATRTATEARVADIWARALAVPEDMLDDARDLFELGADSLMAARVVAELRRSVGVALGVHDVFRERTVARLAARIDAARTGGALVDPVSVPEHPSDRGLPLSFSQEQVWLHQQTAPEAVFYNEPLDITIPEALDLPAFERALDLLIERHEALRVRVEVVAGVPTQRIAAHQHRPLAVADLRHLPPASAEAEGLRLASALAQRPFDLAGEPLLRTLLVRLADDRCRLHMTGHHIILDGVTMFQIVLPELESVYRDLVAGRPPALPPLALRFRDVVAWTRSPPAAARWSTQEAHWKQQLAGAEPLELPYDRPRAAHPSPAGARRCFTLSQALSRDLRELAAQRGSTLFTTLLAAFAALLFRYTQQRDLTIASVVAARPLDGLDRVAGNFLNTVLLRTAVPADGSFLDLLSAVERTCVDALEHGEVPFQRVARYAPADPSGARDPIRAAFVLEPAVAASPGGWTLGQHAVHTETAKFDLTFELDEREDGILARVEYRTELFEAEAIARMIEHFERLLANVVADPGALLTAPELLDLPEVAAQARPHARPVAPAARRAPDRHLAPRTDVERTLTSIWRDVLRLDELAVTDDFFDVGGDSLTSLTVVARAAAAGLPVAMRDLLELRTIERLAARLAASAPTRRPTVTEPELVGPCPTLPIQRWFLDRDLADAAHFNQAFVVRAAARLDPARLERALARVIADHPALRTRIRRDVHGAASLRIMPAADPSSTAILEVIDATNVGGDDEPILLAAAARLTARIDPERGPMIAAALLDRGPAHTSKLWVGIHHLGIDGVSWRVLLEAWGDAYHALAAGQAEPTQPPPSWSVARWARALAAYVDGEARDELFLWKEQLAGPAPSDALSASPGTVSSQRTISQRLTPTATASLLLRAPRATGTPINAFFLVALHAALGRWLDADDLCVWLEGHGRESITDDVDLTRTIGWLTSLFPIRLQLDRHEPLLARLAAVARALARPAHHGLGYLALRTLATDPAIRAALAPPRSPLVTFNYLGRLDDGADERLLTISDAPAGPLHGPANARFAALDINCFALGGQLRIDVAFSTEQLDAAAVERFSAGFVAELAALLAAVDDAAPARANAHGEVHRAADAILRLRDVASAKRPLFLVHPAGGSAFGYRELVRHLDADQPVYGLECTDGYAGKTLTSMAAGYVEAMRAVQPAGPYVLGGWSLGGILAAEMARQLERAGEAVTQVIQLDSRPAQHAGQRRYLTHMQEDSAALLSLLARHLGLMVGATLGLGYAALREIPAATREGWFVDRLAERGAFSEALNAGFVRRFVADFLAAGHLITGLGDNLPIRAPMLLLRASTSSVHYAGFPALEEPVEVGADTTYGWGSLTEGGCAVELVGGTHEDLLFGAHVRGLAERVSHALRSQ